MVKVIKIMELGQGEIEGRVLDHILSLLDLKAIIYASQVYAAAIATAFSADATSAELVGDWSVGFYTEFYSAALATSFKEPSGRSEQERFRMRVEEG